MATFSSLPARRIAAAALLAAATLVALGATQRLGRLRDIPLSSWPYYAAFALAVVLAFFAGRAELTAPAQERPGESPAPPELACRPLVTWAAGAAAVLLLLRTWKLDQLAAPPPSIYLWWLGGIVAAVFAFPAARRSRPAWTPRLPMVLVACALVAAAAARLPNLGHSPAVYGGDEANQAMDGRSYLEGRRRESPFGTGWYFTMRPGMLLAGVGARLSSDPVAGARLPFAIAGTLSVAATAAAGAAVAGPWGAASAAALLAFAPHHVHFSRLSSVMILDAFFAPLLVFLLLALRRTGSPRVAVLTGVAAGLALYGYSGGRAITVVFLLAAPAAALRSPATGRARRLLLPALLLGFLAAAGPNLQFAVQRFDLWNGRFNQVSVLSGQWWKDATTYFGPPASIVSSQFALGTVGLLSTKDMTTWFAGYPLIGPALLVALAFAGFGWLFGRRQILSVALLMLIAAANVAGVVLTTGAPAPQRASSLFPILAILGGAAVAGFLALVPEAAGRVRWRTLAGVVFVTVCLAATGARRPSSPDSSPDYAGAHGAFAQTALGLMRIPGWQSEPAYLYGLPYLSTDLPTFQFSPDRRRIEDVHPAVVDAASLRPGLHFFAPEFEDLGRRVREESSRRGFALPHPVDPLRNVGYLVRVPAVRPVEGS